jgi:hypothetical protein
MAVLADRICARREVTQSFCRCGSCTGQSTDQQHAEEESTVGLVWSYGLDRFTFVILAKATYVLPCRVQPTSQPLTDPRLPDGVVFPACNFQAQAYVSASSAVQVSEV